MQTYILFQYGKVRHESYNTAVYDGHSDIAVTLNVYTHVGLEDVEKELQKMQVLENARKEMGILDMDDKPLKQNMFKVV